MYINYTFNIKFEYIYSYKMTQFIRCPSCGFCFGSYVEFFDKAKLALYQDTIFAKDSKYAKYDPEKLALNPGSAPPLESIFDALDIKNRCCRMRLLTKMDFDKMYK